MLTSDQARQLKEAGLTADNHKRGHLSLGSSSYPGVRSQAGERENNVLRMEENGGRMEGVDEEEVRGGARNKKIICSRGRVYQKY
jgi:hypothetical protein